MSSLLAALTRLLPPVCPSSPTLLLLPQTLLTSAACLKATISLLLGTAIVLLATVIKLPQIHALRASRSAVGLSTSTLLIETFAYIYNLSAHIRLSYPLSTYGDFIALLLQNCVLISLVFRYSARPQRGMAAVSFAAALLAVMCSPLFPVAALRALTLANVPVAIAARVPQIVKNFRAKSTGALSAVTCCGLFLGASARVFTTLQEVDNPNILIGYLTSATLNGIVAFQVLFYGNRGVAPSAEKLAAAGKTE